MTDNARRKEVKSTMIKRFSKLTMPVVIAAAALAFVLSPSVGLANTAARTMAQQTQVLRQPVRQSVYFHTPAAKTENHVRSLEQVIQDQRDWYQMID
jgi:short subunit fatty acids transporter